MAGSTNGKQALRDPVVCFRSYLYGGISSLLSTIPTLIVFPVYKTVFRQQIHNTTIHRAVAQLYSEGPVKLYRGVVPPLLMRTLNGTLLFGLQDTLLCQLSLSSQNVIPICALPALAGMGAGVVEALVFTPFERVQNVLQNGRNDHHTLKSVLIKLKSQEVVSGYYRGFLPITARNTLGSALYFGLKGPMCSLVAGQGLSPVASSFVSGMLTSMAISLTLYPLSVLVANMQSKVADPGEVKGVMASWRKLWKCRQQSVGLLYRGGSLVILRSCITWGITTAIYDKQVRASEKLDN